MRGRLLGRYVAPAVLLTVVLAGCSSDGGSDGGADGGSPSPTPADTSSASPSETASSTPSPSESTSSAPAGGTAEQPEVLEPTTDTLAWKPVPGSVDTSVTRATTDAGDWSLAVTQSGGSAVLKGPDGRSSGVAASGRRVSDALLDESYAVVVLQDKAEERPATARVVDLATGKAFTLDGRSDVPTANGGTWALEGDRLVHATYSGSSYCLASVDLGTRTSTLGWCAPKRNGFSNAQITPSGTSMLTFDDAQPSCRTVVAVDGTETTPFTGVTDCKAWDSVLLDDGAVWSVVPKERQVDSAHFYGRSGDGYFDLGPGSSGTLEWCAGASYFVRDPQRDGDPAALMRWTAADGLSVAYESPAGEAFLDRPRCGGNTLTVTAFAEGGDEQVSVRLP